MERNWSYQQAPQLRRNASLSPSPSTSSSVRSSKSPSPAPPVSQSEVMIGDRVIVKGSQGVGTRKGVLRFMGEVHFAPGKWCGIELDFPNGKNDGVVEGKRYFSCKSKFGIFVPISKISVSPTSKSHYRIMNSYVENLKTDAEFFENELRKREGSVGSDY